MKEKKQVTKKASKVRMWKVESTLRGTTYVLETKGFLGWSQPDITYSGGAEFYNESEANRWFEHIAGGLKVKKTLIKQS